MNLKFLANIITFANLLYGFLSILFVINGQPVFAAWLIIAAVVCDGLDGKVARKFSSESHFGKEFDSLSDFVSFGVAPMVLFFYAVKVPIVHPALILLSLFLFCGAYRLARFNISASRKPKANFQGLPIPAAGGAIASLVLLFEESALFSNPLLALLLVTTLSFLMISKIPYPSFKKQAIQKHKLILGFVIFLACFIIAPGFSVCMLFLFYIVLSPLQVKPRDHIDVISPVEQEQ